jgi:hypothetical protein
MSCEGIDIESLQDGCKDEGNPDKDWDKQECQTCQLNVLIKHHRYVDNCQNCIEHQGKGGIRQKVTYLPILAKTGHEITYFTYFEIPQWQGKQMLIKSDQHPQIDLHARMHDEIPAYNAHQNAEYQNKHHSDEHDVEHGSVVMAQDFVNNILSEDGCC